MQKENTVVRLLKPAEVSARIFELETLLKPAFDCSVGELTALDALVLATEEKMWVFVGENNSQFNAAIITEFIDFPRRRVFSVVGWAGRSKKFNSQFGSILQWAKANGAAEVRGYGPERMAKYCQKLFGFEEIYRVYRKEL